jgi:hypothetical protein
MSKKLKNDSLVNELEGGSAFFTPKTAGATEPKVKGYPPSTESGSQESVPSVEESSPVQPTNPDSEDVASTESETQASLHASTLASIRSTVRKIGKESVYVRATPEEKLALSDIVYALKREGVRTTENEVSRIALNFLIEDYKQKGKGSVLAQVIAALQA